MEKHKKYNTEVTGAEAVILALLDEKLPMFLVIQEELSCQFMMLYMTIQID
jgi:hypothetical protein